MNTPDRSTRCSTEIGAGQLPQLLVYNKIDRLGASRAWSATHTEPSQVWISAAQGRGLDLLKADGRAAAIQPRRAGAACRPRPGVAGAAVWQGAVREERSEADGGMSLLVELPPAQMAALARNPHRVPR